MDFNKMSTIPSPAESKETLHGLRDMFEGMNHTEGATPIVEMAEEMNGDTDEWESDNEIL